MIVQDVTNSFLFEILQGGIHAPEDVYRIALYRETAVLSRLTTAYTTKEEVIGSQGYAPGGQVLQGRMVKSDGNTATLGWGNPLWPNASITARGGLIYNFSKQNRTVAVVDLGQNFISTNGNFLVTLPETLIRIGG